MAGQIIDQATCMAFRQEFLALGPIRPVSEQDGLFLFLRPAIVSVVSGNCEPQRFLIIPQDNFLCDKRGLASAKFWSNGAEALVVEIIGHSVRLDLVERRRKNGPLIPRNVTKNELKPIGPNVFGAERIGYLP